MTRSTLPAAPAAATASATATPTPPCRTSRVLATPSRSLLSLLALLAAAASPALAQRPAPTPTPPAATPGAQCPIPPHGQVLPPVAQLRDFRLTSNYVLFVDGKQQPSKLYQSERSGAGLLLSPAFRSALVLKSGALATVDPAKVDDRPDGTVDLRADAVLGPPSTFATDDKGDLTFTAEGRKAALKLQPDLLGLRRLEEVTAHNPEYVISARNYQPNQEALAALRKEQRAVTVRVYYGSWCSHCRKLVPNGVKLEQGLGASHIRFEYFGVRTPQEVPQGERRGGRPEIPTGVVLVNGAEVGRIVGDQAWAAPEVTLRDILADKSARSR